MLDKYHCTKHTAVHRKNVPSLAVIVIIICQKLPYRLPCKLDNNALKTIPQMYIVMKHKPKASIHFSIHEFFFFFLININFAIKN